MNDLKSYDLQNYGYVMLHQKHTKETAALHTHSNTGRISNSIITLSALHGLLLRSMAAWAQRHQAPYSKCMVVFLILQAHLDSEFTPPSSINIFSLTTETSSEKIKNNNNNISVKVVQKLKGICILYFLVYHSI